MKAAINGIVQENSGTVGEGLRLGAELGKIVELGVDIDVVAGVVVGVGVDVGVGVGDVVARQRAAYASPVGLTIKFAMSCDIIGLRVLWSWKNVCVSNCGVQVR